MIRLVLCSRFLALFFVITLAGAVVASTVSFLNISGKYFLIDFNRFYTFEYSSILNTISVMLGKPFPGILGYVSPIDFNNVVKIAKKEYSIIDKSYFLIIAGIWGSKFGEVVVPMVLMLIGIFFSIFLDTISIEKNLQIVAIIGHRKYYWLILSSAIVLSLLYALPPLIPLILYGCPWCAVTWKVYGSMSIFLLFLLLLLLEAIAYVVSGWNSAAGLLVGISFSMFFFFAPRYLADVIAASRGFFGMEPSFTSLFAQSVSVLWLMLFLFISIERREKY